MGGREDEPFEREVGAAEDLARQDPLWPGQVAILGILVLYLVLPPKLTVGPNWILPGAGLLLLVALIAATPLRGRTSMHRRVLVIAFLVLATVGDLVSVGLLIHYLISGGHARGADLINGGALIWGTTLLLFAIWYWEVDRGGPVGAELGKRGQMPDFLFPQMSDPNYAPQGWKPGFGDYLYVALTNQTAFSPTDTMPLSLRAKLLMGVQGVVGLMIVGIILARAVNVLA